MIKDTNHTIDEQRAIRQVNALRAYYMQILTYACVITLLGLINFVFFYGFWWVLFPAAGWGAAIIIQSICMFSRVSFLGTEWERKEIEKRLNRIS